MSNLLKNKYKNVKIKKKSKRKITKNSNKPGIINWLISKTKNLSKINSENNN